ncbi:hypothetical protein [Candidatus Chromulinivorax destructor]|uniref:Uncharacterized protein n=1 Tax=Candidatus Chromulinivorax destructor TaxID=2066483 RepID=A0A345ZCI7_9BACT|nr:hypothetical protein [Candidatus Chromulinivorax destructor]AXK61004.1 hypothetical protein C0J27_04705 [Candidatus Chromulinivorax destructor]
MIHTMIKNRSRIRTIFFAIGLLFSSAIMPSSTVGKLDTVDNGGTGYGTATQADALGYIVTDVGSSTTDLCWGSAVQPDGKTVTVGQSGTSMAMTRYNINGTLDTTFGTGGKVTVDSFTGTTNPIANAVTVLPNGKIVVVGTCTITATTKSGYFVAQFTPAGVLDTTFASGNGFVARNVIINGTTNSSTDIANTVTVDTVGNIYVIGTSNQTASTQSGGINIFAASYTSAGILRTTTYNSGAAVGPGSGSFIGVTTAGIGLISTVGASPGSILAGYGARIDSSGRLVVVGSAATNTQMLIARFTTAGILDTTFASVGVTTSALASGTTIAYGIAFQSSGQIIVAGLTGSTQAAFVAAFSSVGVLNTSFFGTSSSGYITSLLGGTAALARGLVVQPDDKIVIGGYATISAVNNLAIARFTSNGSALDTTFNTLGYTTTNIGSVQNLGNALSVQQNGSFILAGTNSGVDFVAARYLNIISQGSMDYTYNPAVATSPGAPGYTIYPTVATATNKPQVMALQALSDSSLYVVSQTTAVSIGSQIAKRTSTGQPSISSINLSQVGVVDVVVDSQQRALVVGTNATPRGWLYRTTSSSSLAPSFTTVVETNSISFAKVAEQNLGRIIVIGQAPQQGGQNIGLLIAYTESGALATGSTAVPFGTGSAGAQTGFITMTGAEFTDMLIDSTNNIYVAYKTSSDGFFRIAKYLANGSALDSTFGTGGIVNTGLLAANFFQPLLSFDTAGNIVVAASSGGAAGISFQKYDSSGTIIGSTTTITPATSLLSSPQLTKLQCDTNNRLIFTGYDTNNFFVGRCGAGTFTLDTTFAPYSSSPGILKTMYSTNANGNSPAHISNGVCIAPTTGNILFGGYENTTTTTTTSLVGQVVGNTGGTVYTQVNRFPVAVGAVAGTVNLGIGSPANLANGHPQSIYTFGTTGTYANNTLVANATGSSTTLSMLNSSYALNTAFSTDGSITLAGLVSTNNIMVNPSGTIYVTGATATDPAVYSVASDGASATLLNLPEATAQGGLTTIYGIAQQASGRLLIAGYNSFVGSGVIMAFNPVANAVDTSFNASGVIPGYWFVGVAHPVTSISVATSATLADKIYFAYQSGSTSVQVDMVLENGTQLAPSSIFTPISAVLTATSDTAIAMKLDVNGAVVLAVQTSAGVVAGRYAANGAVGVAPATIIPVGSGIAFKELLTLSDSTTLILAQSGASSPYSLSLAQLNPSFTFNSSFGTAGILTAAVSPQVEFFAVDVVSGSDGIIVSGDTNATAGSATPYFTQISNTDAPTALTKVSQSATTLGTPGTVDTTFNSAATQAGFMNLNTVVTSTFTTVIPGTATVKSLLQNDDGSYYVAADDGTDTYLTAMSADDVQNTSFGTTGLLTLAGQANVSAMLLAEDGGFYVVGGEGSTGSAAGWIEYLDGSTGAAISGFAPTATMDSHFAITQQAQGRIIVAGMNDGVGTLIAYNQLTGAVDTTFGNAGYYVLTGYSAINSVVVDLVGNVYVIANDAANNATVICLDENATTQQWSQVVLATTSTLAANNHLTFNQVVNLVATAVNTTTGAIMLKTYSLGTSGGTLATNVILGSGGTATGLTTASVTSVSVDLNASPGKVLLTGYDAGVTPNVPFIIRTTSAETGLDTTFTSGSGTAGVVTTLSTAGDTRAAAWNDLMINNNGKITVAGFNTLTGPTVAPYMMRVYGDAFIGQYDPEIQAPMPDDLNPQFGVNGLAYTSVIANLVNGGSTIVDHQNRIVLAGTADTGANGAFVVARFLADGTLDTSFSTDGIASSGDISALNEANGAYVAVDSSNNVYVGGIDGGNSLVVAKFLGTTGALDTSFGGDGIVISPAIANLNHGGYVAIDYLGNVLVGGSTSGLRLSVARFTSAGDLDTSFGTAGIAQTASISNLRDGGFVATDAIVANADNSVYVGGSTTDSKLVVAKFTSAGVAAAYGTSGIATTSAITNLADGGSIALDINKRIVIGGYTSNNTFVAARFTTAGTALDTAFGTSGIATSNVLASGTLNASPNLVIDNSNNTVLGGLTTLSDGVSRNMVAARFTTTGAIDTTFTTTGIASTSTIAGLTSGGFVAVNSTTTPFLGGYVINSGSARLVVGQIYSGSEIIIPDPANLQGAAFSVYWYGSNPAIFKDFFSVDFYANVIVNATARAATIEAVNASLDAYAVAYADQPEFNLAASTTPGWDVQLAAVQATLVATYSTAQQVNQINAFFTNFNARRTAVRNTLLVYAS